MNGNVKFMLWFDRGDPLEVMLERGAEHYEKKYKRMPTVCYIRPDTMPERVDGETEPQRVAGLELKPYPSMPACHYGIGVGEQQPTQ